jgi:hypothetical protein
MRLNCISKRFDNDFINYNAEANRSEVLGEEGFGFFGIRVRNVWLRSTGRVAVV